MDWSNDEEAISTLRTFISIREKNDQKDPDVEEETVRAPTRDGTELPLRVFRSATGHDASREAGQHGLPLIVLFFGGGFILGSPVTLAELARRLVKRFNTVVVCPTYRLAPEYPFPVGLNDGWDVIKWLAVNANSSIKADPTQGFVVGGVSAGGNLTNVVAHLARDADLQPPITGCWLSAPGVRLAPKDAHKLPKKYNERLLSETQEDATRSATLPPGMRDLIDRSYKRDPSSHLASPMIWPSPPGKDFGEFGHRAMPKNYSQVCGSDAGRDGLLVFDDMLKNEGVPTRLDLYRGLPHCFWHSFKQLPESKKWEQDTLDGFAWLLSRDG